MKTFQEFLDSAKANSGIEFSFDLMRMFEVASVNAFFCEGMYVNPDRLKGFSDIAVHFPRPFIGLNMDILVSDPDNYKSRVLFHELTHATGKKGVLGRIGISGTIANDSVFMDIEEIIAETGAKILCKHFGLNDAALDEKQACYIAKHAKRVKASGYLQDMDEIMVRAEAEAQRAVDYILKHWLHDIAVEQAA